MLDLGVPHILCWTLVFVWDLGGALISGSDDLVDPQVECGDDLEDSDVPACL